MIKIRLVTTVVVLAVMINNCFAAEDLTKWKCQAQVAVQDANSKYCGLTLTPEIYNAARPDLGDIRLIGSDIKQVPYLLTKPKDLTDIFTYNPTKINYSTNAYKQTLITLDFGKQAVKNSIEVITEGSNFRRAVKVEGSNNNIEFFTLVEQSFIFAVGDKYNSRFSKIDLPANDFRYLRVMVAPMPSEDKSPAINEVHAFDTKQKLAERLPVKLTELKHDEDEEHHRSIYEYDLRFSNLPVSEITLEVAGDFYRYVNIEGRDAVTQKIRIESEDNTPRFKEVEVSWQNITSGTIYRYTGIDGEKCQNLVLRIPPGDKVYKLLKVTIQNYDNTPLQVDSIAASMIAAKLIFPRGNSRAITLYVGAESVTAAKYDLEYTLRNPDQIKTSTAQLSSLADNPLFGKKAETIPWTEKHKALLLIALGAVVVVLGGFILKSFKSIQRTQGQ